VANSAQAHARYCLLSRSAFTHRFETLSHLRSRATVTRQTAACPNTASRHTVASCGASRGSLLSESHDRFHWSRSCHSSNLRLKSSLICSRSGPGQLLPAGPCARRKSPRAPVPSGATGKGKTGRVNARLCANDAVSLVSELYGASVVHSRPGAPGGSAQVWQYGAWRVRSRPR
jgi:hypothetical protein